MTYVLKFKEEMSAMHSANKSLLSAELVDPPFFDSEKQK